MEENSTTPALGYNIYGPRDEGGIKIVDSSGNIVDSVNYGEGGVVGRPDQPVYRQDDGSWTTDVYKVTKFSIDDNGIKLTAPKSLTELPEYSQIFGDNSTIKSINAAYKANKDVRVPYMERKEDGTMEETQITVPELVEKWNKSLANFIENVKAAERIRDSRREKYGDKVENLSLTQISQIANTNKDSDRVYLPDFIFGATDVFDPLKNLRDEFGTVSSKDFQKYYNLDNVNAKDLADVMAVIEGHLRGSDWGEDVITFENGETMQNTGSASEAAKALALKQYILSRDPEGKWWQEVGEGAVTLAANAADGFTTFFTNLVAAPLYVLSGTKFAKPYDWNEQKQETFSVWNEQRMLTQDATALLATLGQIGGMVGADIALNILTGGIAEGVSSVYGAALEEAKAASSAVANMGPSALTALTPETLDSIMNLESISLGARLALATAPLAEKMAWATGVFNAFQQGHKALSGALSWTTGLLVDTVHDAILYDGTTLRRIIESSDDENMKAYWLNEFYNNSRWWIGFGVAKRGLKFTAKLPPLQALNVKGSQWANRLIVWAGDKKQAVKDAIYGGDVVKRLEEQIDNAAAGTKRNRLTRKLEIELENQNLRKARKAFANAELDFDGLKLTEESAEKARSAQDSIRQIENSIDHYNQNTLYKQLEMIGLVRDPSTGRKIFVNPDLGLSNVRASRVWERLGELTKKYNLPIASKVPSTIGQDITDYLVGSYEKKVMQNIADAKGPHAADALANLEIIEGNLAVVRTRLPDEVLDYLDDPDTLKAYTNFYYELNQYGISKGVVDEDTIKGYENSPIWKDGYMPIRKLGDTDGTSWVPENGRYHALIQQDIEHFTYKTAEGQHYADPELVRQQRLNAMAKTEINAELYKAYRSIEDATNTVIVSGEDSARVAMLEGTEKNLKIAIEESSKGVSQDVAIYPIKTKKKMIKNITWDEAERTEAISTFSLSETTQILRDKKAFQKGSIKLSDAVTAENYDDWFKNQSKPVQNYLVNYYDSPIKQLGKPELQNNYNLFKRAVEEGGDDFEAGLQRAYLIGDKNFASSSVLYQAIDNLTSGKSAFEGGYVVSSAKGYLKNVRGINTDEFVDEVQKSAQTGVNNYVANVLDDEGAMKAVRALSDQSNGSAVAGKLIALQELRKNEEAKEAFVDEVMKTVKGKVPLDADMDGLRRQVKRIYENNLYNEINITRNALKTTNPELVDTAALYKEVKGLAEEITGAKARDDVVMFLDSKGRQCYAEVDPNFASLYNYRYQMTPTDAMAAAKINAALSKTFRFGTTTLNLASFGNQAFRDTGHALYVGAAFNTIRKSADNLVDVFGQDIVAQIKNFDTSGYEMRQLEKIAEQTGQSLEEAAVSRELARGAALSPASTETVLYREFMKQAYKNPNGLLDNMQSRLNNLLEKYSVDDLMNGRRERYLRNRVFANNYNHALTQGYTVEQARTFAEFAMNNATTNFARQLYHMQAIADSTPYFKAGINGTKSFWRMWSLDPVGITGRFMGGLVLPAMYLTGASLGSKENREVYKNIPEYQKRENLVFIIEKQPISIPIPQEMASLIAPWRHFVEFLYDTNESDFWELLGNDVLGLSPIDLTAFTTIDMDKMIEDPTLKDRISRGVARIFSQVAPVPVKTMYMLATKTDPYTGKKLQDPTYSYMDSETGDIETMDYNQTGFARLVAKLFGEEANATLLEKVVSGVLGTTGTNVIGEIGAIFNEGLGSGISQIGKDIAAQAAKPFDVSVYSLADAAWRRAVNQLEAEKDSITNKDEWKAIYTNLSQETDPEKRKKLMAQGQDMINEFQQRVLQMVKRLDSEYSGTLDRKKFGAVINLLNFNSDPIYQSGTQYSSDIASDAYYEGKNMAVATMEALGVNGANDSSIFGYLAVDREGNTVMRYTRPTAIMETDNVWFNADDIDIANIEAKLKADKIKTQDMWNGYYAAKAQGKQALKQYKSDWNAKVVKSLAPYVTERGVDNFLKNSSVRNLLADNYLLIDNKYQVKAYLKKIFESEQ